MTKLLILGNLFLTAVRAVVVAKLVILGILFLISFILALIAVVVAKLVVLGISYLTSFTLVLRVVLLAKLVISGIFSSIFLILAMYMHLIQQHHFLLYHLFCLDQQEQVLIYQHVIYLTYFSNCLN